MIYPWFVNLLSLGSFSTISKRVLGLIIVALMFCFSAHNIMYTLTDILALHVTLQEAPRAVWFGIFL